MKTAFDTIDIPGLKKIKSGKVREIFDAGSNRLLIVATDRISAFDYVLSPPIPGKGAVLTRLSKFWFEKTSGICPNHMITCDENQMPEVVCAAASALDGRGMLVKKGEVYPIECVVRGYITGSGWEDYKKTGSVCGTRLPSGLKEAQKLMEPIFTPATKEEMGRHDENITIARMKDRIGAAAAQKLIDYSLGLYSYAHDFLLKKGLILADTKFEFGADADGQVMVIDEILTPDSSRYWPLEGYKTGISPPSYDKQFVRDYLKTTSWDRNSEPPSLPAQIVEKTAAKYQEALRVVTSK